MAALGKIILKKHTHAQAPKKRSIKLRCSYFIYIFCASRLCLPTETLCYHEYIFLHIEYFYTFKMLSNKSISHSIS